MYRTKRVRAVPQNLSREGFRALTCGDERVLIGFLGTGRCSNPAACVESVRPATCLTHRK